MVSSRNDMSQASTSYVSPSSVALANAGRACGKRITEVGLHMHVDQEIGHRRDSQFNPDDVFTSRNTTRSANKFPMEGCVTPSMRPQHRTRTKQGTWPQVNAVNSDRWKCGPISDAAAAAASFFAQAPEPRIWTSASHGNSHDARVPRSANMEEWSRVPLTTLVVRNVDRRIRQGDALKYWYRETYNYDLFYLSVNLKKKTGTGRIFMNFETEADAAFFRNYWHGQICPCLSRIDLEGRPTALKIEAGHRQGVLQNVRHWRDKLRWDADPDLSPAMFCRGRRVDFCRTARGQLAWHVCPQLWA